MAVRNAGEKWVNEITVSRKVVSCVIDSTVFVESPNESDKNFSVIRRAAILLGHIVAKAVRGNLRLVVARHPQFPARRNSSDLFDYPISETTTKERTVYPTLSSAREIFDPSKVRIDDR